MERNVRFAVREIEREKIRYFTYRTYPLRRPRWYSKSDFDINILPPTDHQI